MCTGLICNTTHGYSNTHSLQKYTSGVNRQKTNKSAKKINNEFYCNAV